jgi:hypothetical protein
VGRKVECQPYHPARNYASPFQPLTPKESFIESNPAASGEMVCMAQYCRLTALGL